MRLGLSLCALAAFSALVAAQEVELSPGQAIYGDVRVQFLFDGTVRLEERGPLGFEDRKTFLVVKRELQTREPGFIEEDGSVLIYTQDRAVRLGDEGTRWAQVYAAGSAEPVYAVPESDPEEWSFLPAPGEVTEVPLATYVPLPLGEMEWPAPENAADLMVYAVPERTRVVPPTWGATPIPEEAVIDPALLETSGWDLRNEARDLYVIVAPDAKALWDDFLALTGPVPMPPKYVFGLWHSRYHPYTEQDALGIIDRYKDLGFPLDVFVVDTDWRVGASIGYGVNTTLFPDFERFVRAAHRKGARVILNDHPEPQAEQALDQDEMVYRYEGLTSLLEMGVDGWWFDRNWSTTLLDLTPAIPKEVWGMRVYHDILQDFRPGLRPFVMSNVAGVDNGTLNYAPHPAAHRYPIWWTGDTAADWADLRRGVEHAVLFGTEALQPYLSEDLGGHSGDPSPELYTRFVQYGALSPIMRLHSTRGDIRYPWAYGEEAQGIAHDYTRLRYRLFPTLYEASRRAYEYGTPVLRRMDLEYAEVPEEHLNTQYLLGNHLLVAPVTESVKGTLEPIPADYLSDVRLEIFEGTGLSGEPFSVSSPSSLQYRAGGAGFGPGFPVDNFSARASGSIGPFPRAGEYEIALVADDGVRLWLDGEKVIDAWEPMVETTHRVVVSVAEGERIPFRLEYFEEGGQAVLELAWNPDYMDRPTHVERELWLPPGEWMDAWTGEYVSGPQAITVPAPLAKTPMFLRAGGVLVQSLAEGNTQEDDFRDLLVDFVIPAQTEVERGFTRLYEDDGVSNAYQYGRYRTTHLLYTTDGVGNERTATLRIDPPAGDYAGSADERKWRVRFFAPPGYSFESVEQGEEALGFSVQTRPWVLLPEGTAGSPNALGTVVGNQAGPVALVDLGLVPVEADPVIINVTLRRDD
ncbi:MAG: TIM-barrel domain-containing protein [Fimbriimonadaceae bacterium]